LKNLTKERNNLKNYLKQDLFLAKNRFKEELENLTYPKYWDSKRKKLMRRGWAKMNSMMIVFTVHGVINNKGW
jgi:hypothetical protein